MIVKLILAVVVAVVTGLLLVGLIGPLLVSTHTQMLVVIGNFCVAYGWILALLAGIWYFFAGPGYRRRHVL